MWPWWSWVLQQVRWAQATHFTWLTAESFYGFLTSWLHALLLWILKHHCGIQLFQRPCELTCDCCCLHSLILNEDWGMRVLAPHQTLFSNQQKDTLLFQSSICPLQSHTLLPPYKYEDLTMRRRNASRCPTLIFLYSASLSDLKWYLTQH